MGNERYGEKDRDFGEGVRRGSEGGCMFGGLSEAGE